MVGTGNGGQSAISHVLEVSGLFIKEESRDTVNNVVRRVLIW
jgi:hypothetical protein